jgi:flagella basal body P-ring formation protein FlgA
MRRKDCENSRAAYATGAKRRAAPQFARCARAAVSAVLLLVGSPALAGSIRLWGSAVIIEDQIRLGELCDLQGLDAESHARVAGLMVADAPPPGGSKIVRLAEVRAALQAGGTNMAQMTLGGATECAVTRPAMAAPPLRKNGRAKAAGGDGQTTGGGSNGDANAAEREHTLRGHLIDYFNRELARYGGSAEIAFDQNDESILALNGPQYEFQIRRRSGPPLGLVSLEIDVMAGGRILQTVPVIVQLALRRSVVVARRTISQNAAVSPADVEVMALTFRRLDNLGIADPAETIGQRAKRLIPAGSLIEPDTLEKVPLVLRGQLVTIIATIGSIQLVSAGKATEEGRLGDVIRVRSMDDNHAELDAIVTGPGEVRVGPRVKKSGDARLAVGEGP